MATKKTQKPGKSIGLQSTHTEAKRKNIPTVDTSR